MHLQQTKRDSLATGGPQYYFHNLSDIVKTYLRKKGGVRVALVTPYGATKTDFFALSKDHKLSSSGKIVAGSVGHDRIQQGKSSQGIEEAIRTWYNLPKGSFERIDVHIDTVDDCFYLTPQIVKLVGKVRPITIERIERPLTFTGAYQSSFWRRQIATLSKKQKHEVIWALNEINRVVKDTKDRVPHIQEPDLLRASGSLHILGLALGPYVGKGYDCASEVTFLNFPTYRVPVEIKKFSNGFKYQQAKYGKEELSRAVVLCAVHDLRNVQPNIDVIELDTLGKYVSHL